MAHSNTQPRWAKDSIPKPNGWFSPSGEKLVSTKLTQEFIDEFLKQKSKKKKVK